MTALYTVRAVTDRSGWHGKHRPSPFAAAFAATTTILGRELTHLRARNVILELDVDDAQVLVSGGGLRKGARTAGPGVRLVFDSKHGQLVYATDVFDVPYGADGGWRANLRAVALTMEDQRRIERYGVSQGRQYTGHRAIGSGTTPVAAAMTVEEAATVIAAASGYSGLPNDLILGAVEARAAYRSAALTAHPDHGGDVGRWLRLQQAKDVLDRHHGVRS